MRSLSLLAFGCLVGLLLYTYDLKYKTRKLEVRAKDLAAELQDESDFLALMRAEVGYLARPDRIEEMARKQLKLEPISPSQLVSWKTVIASSGADALAQSAASSRKDGIAALIDKAAAPPARASR
jgi:cell division protein FtsL